MYIVRGKRQINYKFIPTGLFRGCPLYPCFFFCFFFFGEGKVSSESANGLRIFTGISRSMCSCITMLKFLVTSCLYVSVETQNLHSVHKLNQIKCMEITS